MSRLRIAMLLPGLGRVQRGAEMAFLELASQWHATGQADVDAFTTGSRIPDGIRSIPARCLPREFFENRWPRLPMLRTEFEYEELTYVANLWWNRRYRPADYDVAFHCSYPYVNWYLQRSRAAGYRPLLAYVTQNGDWPARRLNREYRYFNTDALICTNPEYFDRHQHTFPSALIPNGVDATRFAPRDLVPTEPRDPRLPTDRPIVVMAAALVPYKHVLEAIEAVALVPNLFLALAGDGPLRNEVAERAARLLPGRHLLYGSIPRDEVPKLFRQGQIFLHMSRNEPSALVYCEAAASGLAMVVHDAPVPRWTLGDAALYVDTANIQAVADTLKQALEPGRAAGLGATARKRMLDGFTWPVLAQRYLNFFRERLDQHPKRGR